MRPFDAAPLAVALAVALLVAPTTGAAQHQPDQGRRHGGPGAAAPGAASAAPGAASAAPGAASAAHATRGGAAGPYAGLERRRVKSLSAEAEADLRAGRGMALALAAELNGHPGPMHVLEHADALALTPAQRATAETLRAAMLAEAREVGARIVAREEELDALFASGTADRGRLAALAAEIGALNGRLREVHLATHIALRAAMTPEQVGAYARLRGYAGG